MGVGIIVGKADGSDTDNAAVLYNSVSDWAFGPIFNSFEEAEDFLAFLSGDARGYIDARLLEEHDRWRAEAFDGTGLFVGSQIEAS